jgi:hypothetical protein
MDQLDIYKFRKELRNLTDKELLEIAFKQRERSCLLGGLCHYKITYKGVGFCISELLGKGCEMEYLRTLLAEEGAESKCQRSREPLPLPISLRFPDLR